MDDFGSTLRRYRLRAGLSQNAFAKVVGINASYINRLESGEREAPTRELALALARALHLTAGETDCLHASAGYLPPGLQKLGPADSTIAAVTRLLTNDRLSPEARADFRAIVETMAIRWQGGSAAGVRAAATPPRSPSSVSDRRLRDYERQLADAAAEVAGLASVGAAR